MINILFTVALLKLQMV